MSTIFGTLNYFEHIQNTYKKRKKKQMSINASKNTFDQYGNFNCQSLDFATVMLRQE